MSRPTTFPLPLRLLAERGFPIQQLCTRARVSPTGHLSTDDFFRLWIAAEDMFADPATGLRFGTGAVDGGYGVATTVALHAPDLRRALSVLSRYKRLTCPELVEVETSGGEAIVRYRWLEATSRVPRLLADTALASLMQLTVRGSAGQIAPIRVELARRPSNHALLHQHFGCPVLFGAAYNAMIFDQAALDVPFVTAEDGAFERMLRGLQTRLDQGEGFALLVGELRVAIARQLNEGRPPTMAALALRLGLSGRTLQRRLAECGTSFQQQLDGVRRTAASRFLAETELDPVAISMLLGFAEPNSFARAFRGWERTTPLRWRARQSRPLT
ncbi:AraC family transcriptional regulator [Paraburkholderia tropica]|uniref:AraC family transcriptional regulator n=1 Tax=Paraburkholderia tropica TaxID=92647 RepID=UPI0007EE0D90|nr:AraC family transcriptional regulator [Paraburkholderia tropica]OBR54766.1 hypothetical protein A6456_35020 [Paraburkholderia tropica]